MNRYESPENLTYDCNDYIEMAKVFSDMLLKTIPDKFKDLESNEVVYSIGHGNLTFGGTCKIEECIKTLGELFSYYKQETQPLRITINTLYGYFERDFDKRDFRKVMNEVKEFIKEGCYNGSKQKESSQSIEAS